MKTITINQNNPTDEEIQLICDYLEKGKVIAYPTDTVMGLGCLANNEKAVKKIYKIKERPKELPLLVLVKSYCDLHKYVYSSKKQEEYIRKIWPKTTREAHDFKFKKKYKPTTFIFRSRGELPSAVSGGQDSLAVRLPRDEFLIKILKKINAPLISTSLNKHCQKPPKDYNNIDKYFKIAPDLAVFPQVLPEYKESSIIDIRDINNIKILRK
jgi:L-threonylcarbamoyladenylate synthase